VNLATAIILGAAPKPSKREQVEFWHICRIHGWIEAREFEQARKELKELELLVKEKA
jgi:hypothetical protein